MGNQQALIAAEKFLSGISAFTCLLVIILYASAKPLRITAFKVIFWLNFSNFCKATAIALPSTSNFMCQLTAYIYYSSTLAGLLWTYLVARKLYESIIQVKEDSEDHYYSTVFNFFIIPYCICSVPLVFDAYGLNSGLCLVKDTKMGDFFHLIIYFAPAFVIILYCSVVYAKILKKLKRRSGLGRDALRLRYFPLILVLCFTPVLIVRVLQYFGIFNGYSYFAATIVIRLQGFFDAAAYVYTPPVMRYLRMICSNKENDEIGGSDLFSPVEC